ncbi:cation:proton antiporter [Persicirhabdus sediminis]|uniref:Cation:proton antiporter n=1 Tax=Persicirhabdus sediminis TaxID=454144 RepID=A0A8J7MHH0_9BACT|nr:sodium:proton antiporter [Persicirhabdus sediminis]MBK1792817.1 cation:proton antiporter [Persicirhabdus sediminis]
MAPLTYLTLILGIGILAQWLAWRFRFPSILLLLISGFALEFFSGVSIDAYLREDVLLAGIGLCVSLILFEGGLTLKFADLRESGTPVLRLCTIAVVVSFILTGAVTHYILGYDWRVAGLLGAILVVTGPTVIAPLLRHIKPSRKVGNIVKWEGIVVDPIGAILAVLIFQAAIAGDADQAQKVILISLGKTILVGGVMAVILAKLIEQMLKRHLIPDFLHSVVLLAINAVAFSASNEIQPESGLLTSTVLGIALANQKSVSVKHILEFKENLRVLIISLLFVVLSGRIAPASIYAVLVPGLILLFFLIVIIRPASVFIANIFSKKVSLPEKAFLAALAPRGIVAAAVTSVFALEMEHAAKAGHLSPHIAEQANHMVALIFIVIIGTVTFYGLLAAPIARRLGLAAKNPRGVLFAGAAHWTRLIAKALQDDGHSVLLLDTNYDRVARARVHGLNAKRANILSEYVEEELDLTGLGQLIACTPNDEVNSLASQEFIHIFGSENIWQVAPRDDNRSTATAVASRMRSRISFPGRPQHLQLESLAKNGATIEKSILNEALNYASYVEQNPEHIVLFVDNPEKGGLKAASEDTKAPGAGTIIYSLVPATSA